MAFLLSLIYWETVILLFCAFGMVAALALAGQMNLNGLFVGLRRDGSTYFSPERVQLFLFTLAVAFLFLSAVLRDPTHFPDVPDSWIAMLGGSHVFYLTGKMAAGFLGKR